MTSYRSYSNGKIHEFKKGRDISGGAFGKVGEVLDRPDFVYKEIVLTPKPGDWVITSRDMRIKGLYRELWALKKQNLLEGYIHEGDTVFLIMRKIKGTVECKFNPNPLFDPKDPNSSPFTGGHDVEMDRTIASFKALRELNYQGIYHADPHPMNCLIEIENGKPKAKWIDFGFATEHSYLASFIQSLAFDLTRPFGFQTLISNLPDVLIDKLDPRTFDRANINRIKAAKKEVDDQHKLAYYATLGFYVIAGIGVVSVCGLNSFLLWQFIHSYVERQVIIELRTLLNQLDIAYLKFKDTATTDAQRNNYRIFKALINLGYLLINAYTLRSLYLNVQNLQIISNLSKCIESTLGQGLVDHLDKLLAEMTYLYMQIGMTAKSFTNMLEKVPPVNCLLVQMDMTYQYNPTLLFRNVKTRIKERYYGPELDNLENKLKLAK